MREHHISIQKIFNFSNKIKKIEQKIKRYMIDCPQIFICLYIYLYYPNYPLKILQTIIYIIYKIIYTEIQQYQIQIVLTTNPSLAVQMSDQQILPCIICGQHNEQMLMLVCMDDPCINCAAIHYCSSNNNTNSNVYSCAKCGEVTQLDSSSIVQLQRVYGNLKVKKRYDYRKGQGSITNQSERHQRPTSSNRNIRKQYKLDNSQTKQYINREKERDRQNRDIGRQRQRDNNKYEQNIPSTYKNNSHQSSQSSQQQVINQSYTPISQPSYPSNPYNNINITNINSKKIQQQFYMCQTHPQQQLSYFCFNCSNPICPECAIHGTHREHEVQTTRKAIKTIKNNLNKCQQNITNEIANTTNIIDSYKNKLKQFNIEIKKQKDLIRDNFTSLRNILNEKQKQFNKSIDIYIQTNTNIIKNQISSYDHIIQQNINIKKSIENTLKKDDLTILQQYNKRQKDTNNVIENNKNKKYNPDLDGLKEIDYQMFKDQMDQLNGILGALRLTVQAKRKNM